MPWLWLIVGGLFEVGFTTSLRFVDRGSGVRTRTPTTTASRSEMARDRRQNGGEFVSCT